MKNQPYIKEYNEAGEVINPIEGKYLTEFPSSTRSHRRNKKERFAGNNKGWRLAVGQKFKYYKCIQVLECKNTGKTKRIEHYVLAK